MVHYKIKNFHVSKGQIGLCKIKEKKPGKPEQSSLTDYSEISLYKNNGVKIKNVKKA